MKKIIIIRALKSMKKMVTFTNRKIANHLALIACFITYKKEKRKEKKRASFNYCQCECETIGPNFLKNPLSAL